MMGFYGYNPAQFVSKDRFGIGAASQILGQGIASVPGQIREKERLELDKDKILAEENKIIAATKAADANWKDMDTAATVARKQYIKKANIAIQNGLMTEEEKATNLKKLRMPTSVDKKDPAAYMKNYRKVSDELFDDLQKRQRSSQVTQLGQQVQQPGFTPEPAPGQLGEQGFQVSRLTESAPTTQEGAVQKAGQLAAKQNMAPLVEEEKQQIIDASGTQPAKDVFAQQEKVAAQERQKELDLVTANNRDFDEKLKRDRERRLRIAASFDKTQKLTKTEKDDLKYKIGYYNKQIEGLTQSLNMNKQRDEPNQDIIDGIKLKITEAQRVKDENFKLLNDAIKKGKDQAEAEKPIPTVQDISAKFGYLPPDQLDAVGRLLKSENPETGVRWTIDEVFEKFQAAQGGYQAPNFRNR